MKKLVKPTHLKKGDFVGIVSPSSPLAGLVPHRVEKGIRSLEKIGFKVKVGKNALKISGYTAGTPRERAEDINDFFADPKIKAIFTFIGGNHSNQILDYLDFDLIKKNPKLFLGYSDATVLHLALYSRLGMVTFYGPSVLTQFGENPEIFPYTKEYFEKALMHLEPIGKVSPSLTWTDEILDWFKREDEKRPRKMKKNKGWQWIKEGKAQGPILGGCISSMMHLRGTKYWPSFKNCILFWEIPESEDILAKGEKPATIDAYLVDLGFLGVFGQIKGMIIGRPYGYSELRSNQLVEIIKERTKSYDFPILFSVDIGHTDPMLTVPLGVMAKINSAKNIFEFVESGVE